MTQNHLCLNCGTLLNGKYCHNCGQKDVEGKERTVKHFVFQFFGAAFFLENNFLKNLWYLLSRPGFLPREWMEGKRRRYMNPISLFLLINLVYFMVVQLSDLNLKLHEQMNHPIYSGISTYLVNQKLKGEDITMETYSKIYNDRSSSLSRTIIIIHAPIMALLLMMIYFNKKIFYFVDHVIFCLSIMGFVLLLAEITRGLHALMHWLSFYPNYFTLSGYILLITIPLYIILSTKRFFNEKWVPTLLKSPLVLISFLLSHLCYRFVLFLLVWTTT